MFFKKESLIMPIMGEVKVFLRLVMTEKGEIEIP